VVPAPGATGSQGPFTAKITAIAAAEASRTADGSTTTPTTIRIAGDSATTEGGARTSFSVQLGDALDPSKP